MIPKYIIIQAGGKGTRMERLTRNRPKALVPVDNLPMIFHLFKKYPDSRYIIIGDYKFDVLTRYLDVFADVSYVTVSASGSTGTCAGVSEAVSRLPAGVPFMLIWSDLILPDDFNLPKNAGNYVGVAKDFPCRWKYEDGVFAEERTDTFGVAGLFIFHDKSLLKNVPADGEFVKWLSGSGIELKGLPLYKVKEYGVISEYEKKESSRCRPFNRTYVEGGYFVKEPIDDQGRELAKREVSWYREVERGNFKNIPRIESYEPLKMELISGGAVYEKEGLSYSGRRELLKEIVDCLKSVQALKSVPSDRGSYYDAYIGKTFRRLEKVRKLVPFAEDEHITVNGRRCRNVFFIRGELEKRIEKYFPKEFKLIHGDCTFSNMMLRDDGTPVLIDPRGYFGTTELYGDPAYDWSKLYYSIVGNYDRFNRKRFTLKIGEDGAELEIESNGWENLEGEFFRLLDGEVEEEQVKLIHSIIWLSLTTYAWEDYDSICGAFYNGLYYLEEVLQ